ncbi:MAG: LysM peptidoglycan-binding domain-containing protein [Clostridia bacterium]|nr:LysM peptidoglycan-binding domain-containing protein [Clostridia bacterium]
MSEDTTAKLVAWLCKKHGLDPKTDVYTHKYFYPRKQCPQYILPHWNTFLSTVQKYYNTLTDKAVTPKTEPAGRTYTVKHGDILWQIAQTLLGKGNRYTEIVKLNGLKSNVLMSGQVLLIPEK